MFFDGDLIKFDVDVIKDRDTVADSAKTEKVEQLEEIRIEPVEFVFGQGIGSGNDIQSLLANVTHSFLLSGFV
jgi:hypothetical protein